MDYYVNTQPQSNGDHEVHKRTCMHLPVVSHRRYLGNFATDQEALREARKTTSGQTAASIAAPRFTCTSLKAARRKTSGFHPRGLPNSRDNVRQFRLPAGTLPPIRRVNTAAKGWC